MNICPICGAECMDDARFCYKCGAQLPEFKAEPEESAVPDEPEKAVEGEVTENEAAENEVIGNQAAENEEIGNEVIGNEAAETNEAVEASQSYQQAPNQNASGNGSSQISESNGSASGSNGEVAPAKPKKKRKTLKIILISLAAILLAGAAAVYFLIFNNPKYKVLKALENDITDLSAITENCETLNTAIDNMTALAESGDYSFSAKGDYKDGADSVNVGLNVGHSKSDKILAVDVSADCSSDSLELSANLGFSGNEKETMFKFGLRNYNSEVYSFKNEGFGKAFEKSELYTQTGWFSNGIGDFLCNQENINYFPENEKTIEQFKEEYSEEWDAFSESLVVEKCDESIKHAGDATVYKVEVGFDELADLLEAAAEFNGVTADVDSLRDLEDIDIELYVGIESKHITAIKLSIEKEDIIITLSNEGNVWNNVVIYDDRDKIFTLQAKSTDKGFTVKAWPTDDKDEAVTLICNDKKKSISVEYDGDEIFKLEYDCKDGGIQLRADLADVFGVDKLDVEISITALKDKPKMLSESGKDLMELDVTGIDAVFQGLKKEILIIEGNKKLEAAGIDSSTSRHKENKYSGNSRNNNNNGGGFFWFDEETGDWWWYDYDDNMWYYIYNEWDEDGDAYEWDEDGDAYDWDEGADYWDEEEGEDGYYWYDEETGDWWWYDYADDEWYFLYNEWDEGDDDWYEGDDDVDWEPA